MAQELYILPNTGHHYFFIPFTREFLNNNGGPRGDLAKFCKSNGAWQAVVLPDESGKMVTYSWLRYRFGTKGGNNNFGVWLAVESNIGTIERGTLFDEREVTSSDLPTNPADYAPSPYAYASVDSIRNNTLDAFRISLAVKLNGQTIPLEEPIDIIWQEPSEATIDVDLVVDFGNTRTVVLALEDNPQMAKNGDLGAVCKNIPFLPRGQEFPDKEVDDGEKKFESIGEPIADSWFLLQEPMFSEWDFPSYLPEEQTPFTTSKQYIDESTTKVVKGGWLSADKTVVNQRFRCVERVPQMFVEISPALMGQEAKNQMHNIDLELGMNISMSSPKRYLWDREQFGNAHGQQAWNLNPNPWSGIRRRDRLTPLHGQICRYMYMDGRDWDISQPPFEDPVPTNRPVCVPSSATYPRSSAMVWSALTILESAYRQITSYNWRKGNNPFMNRRLRNVNITFPSGWIARERAYYREAWKQAVDIFTLAHMDSRESIARQPGQNEKMCDLQGRPELCVDLDEAVASQIPFIYSEIKRLSANLWIALYGRNPQPGNYLTARVRVMTIDIGGGTLDTSIVEYRNVADGDSVALRYKVLFRDCSSFAGDSVTKAIIERVLLPAFLDARGVNLHDENDEMAAAFVNVVRDQQLVTLADKAKWQRIVTLLFLPIVRQWLTDVATCPGGVYEGEEGSYRSIEDCGADEKAIEDFNKYLHKGGIETDTFVMPNDRLQYNPDDINKCIEEELRLGIEPLGKFIAAYDVDVVTLSGKISEMPVVEELLHKKLPISKQRIVRMKDYFAGRWYPMSDNQRIGDAKTVTAVGAALYAAGKNHLLGNSWNIEEDIPNTAEEDDLSRRSRNYWGRMSPGAGMTGFDGILLKPEEDTNADKTFIAADDNEYYGSSIMINTYIGRQKYQTQDTVPERQYKLEWIGDPQKAPTYPLAIVVQRKPRTYCQYDENGLPSISSYEMQEDDIELVTVQPTSPRDVDCFNHGNVQLKLRTMSDSGFWMEECRFNMDY